MLEIAQPDAVAEPVTQFFTPPQFAALRRLAVLIEPPTARRAAAAGAGFNAGGITFSGTAAAGTAPAAVTTPGPLECNVPEFLDFLISVSPVDRKTLYRNGLDTLNANARKQFNKAFADLDDTQAHTIVQPHLVAVPWVTDPPSDPMKHFIFAIRQDVPMATRNSPEFAAAGASSGRRGGGAGLVWNPIDPVYRG